MQEAIIYALMWLIAGGVLANLMVSKNLRHNNPTPMARAWTTLAMMISMPVLMVVVFLTFVAISLRR